MTIKRISSVFAMLLISVALAGRPGDPEALWSEFQSEYGGSWKAHTTDRGYVRSMYGRSPVLAGDAMQAAQSFLRDAADVLGIDRISDLRRKSVERAADGMDLTYSQYFSGLPVAGAEVTIHLDRQQRAVAATSTYAGGLRPGPAQLASESTALRTAMHYLRSGDEVTPAGLWIVPVAGEARAAWRFEATGSGSREGSYILYIDAAEPYRILRVHRTYARAEGQANIYPENPVVTPERSFQTLKYMDGTTSLSGNFVKTYNANYEHYYSSLNDPADYTTASEPSRRFDYPVTDARFSETMAYFHTVRVHDQWRSFGFNKLNVRFPVFVNVMSRNGGGYDNAYYTRFSRYSRFGVIVVGAGEELENLGWDADTYYHEYGHAVLDRSKPGFFEAMETNYGWAFHEAFGDISASAITGNSRLGEYALRLRATKKFVGRDLDNTNKYPQNAIDPAYKKTEAHYTGLIIGGAWWDLQKSVGVSPAQQLLYKSLPMIPNEMTFFDVRDAVITADQKLHGGANTAAIQQAFARHGLDGDDPGQTGTVEVRSLKPAALIIKDGRVKFQFRNTFKPGEIIWVFANYTGANLTPGYNLVAEKVVLNGPAGSQIDAYGGPDEVINGSHSGKQGVFQAEVDLYPNTKPGKYTLTVQSRLGGTSTLSPEKSVSFQVKP